MDISMFFEFPGILITIGAVLLLLSIVLLIIAFKSKDEPEVAEDAENKEQTDDSVVDSDKPKEEVTEVPQEEVKSEEVVEESKPEIQLMSDTEFIKITLSDGSTVYGFASHDIDMSTAGKEYTFNIMVTATGLGVAATVQDWGSTTSISGSAVLQ